MGLTVSENKKSTELSSYHGNVLAVNNISVNDRGLPKVMITVELNNGLQKSIDLKGALTVIPGNKIAFILNSDEDLVFIKNFSSNETITAILDHGGSGGSLLFLALGIGGLMLMFSSRANTFGPGLMLSLFGFGLCYVLVRAKVGGEKEFKEKLSEKIKSMGLEFESSK